MSEFGSQLKQARESRGISLRQIATSTKISTVALESLERGDLSKLPGGIFSRAFVRAYAIEVGLDPDDVVAQFLVELGVHESQADKGEVHPEVTADDRAFLEQQRRAAMGLRIAIVVFVVLVIVAVMAWRVTNGATTEGNAPAPEQTPAVSDSAQTPESTVGGGLASDSPDVTTTTGEAPSAGGPAALSEQVPLTASTRALWIDVMATESCWLQVTTDGNVVPGRVLAAGERLRFEASREMVLQVGSAGAITWSVNGRQARSLGRIGDVRTVTISSANVSQFYQEPDAPPTPTASATAHP
jgi:cytoskeleton protein RodZ